MSQWFEVKRSTTRQKAGPKGYRNNEDTAYCSPEGQDIFLGAAMLIGFKNFVALQSALIQLIPKEKTLHASVFSTFQNFRFFHWKK